MGKNIDKIGGISTDIKEYLIKISCNLPNFLSVSKTFISINNLFYNKTTFYHSLNNFNMTRTTTSILPAVHADICWQ